MSELNDEQLRIINAEGNILVTANPGTGKTLLLAHKFLSLVKNGFNPEQILCLTFTDKAKREMEGRIINLLFDNAIPCELSKLNIYTFHSFALNNIEEQNIISSNLLRFSIYTYLRDTQIFNYSDSYLIDTIVPRTENLIRYLKSFGITPDKIDLDKTRAFLNGNDKIGKEEIDKYAEYFLRIFEHYEKSKEGKGLDYADLLIRFLEERNIPQFEVVLVDELQDVNKMEADIALRSAKQFIAVGDKKQAIFGFQGGSIINFKHFENSTQFVLSENFRSTDQILKFASEHFVSKTSEISHREELKGLKNAEGKTGEKPVIYEVNKDSIPVAVKTLVQRLMKTTHNLSIITRTNFQIMYIARELKSSGINFSTTFFTASTEAKANIIKFLKGVLSNDIIDMTNAMFTPFFPISLQEAFEVSEIRDLTMDLLYQKCPEFQKLRSSIRNVEDVNTLFNEKIIPVSLTYGEEYLSAAIKLQEAYKEALNVIEHKTINNLMIFLDTADLLTDEFDRENRVILTTVHKAKGKEFDTVIYVPTKTMDRSSFQDEVVEAILKCNGMDVKEEIEEESLRINFVAFTRAINRLFIVTDRTLDFLNEHAVSDVLLAPSEEESEFIESRKKAYAYFLSGEFDKAKELLAAKKKWLLDYVKSYFESLGSISFSTLTDSAYDYFVNSILRVKEYSPALTMGSEVHIIAEKTVRGIECDVSEELLSFKRNIEFLCRKISAGYPDLLNTEYRFKVPFSDIIETDEKVFFSGYIDAIFKNKDNYLIVDWKTDKNQDSDGKHRQQLEAYKRAFCAAKKVTPDKVKVAIGFVGLRPVIKTGKVEALLDDKQPQKTTFDTFSKKVNTILEWKKDPHLFFEKLIEENKVDDVLWRSIVETYKAETL